MWNPFRGRAEQPEDAGRAAAEQDAAEARQMDYIVAMERADTAAEWEQVRNQFDDRQWVGQPVEPWTQEQIEAREAEIQESLDWADWGEEIRPNDAGEASI